jgi:putative CRISPR-associated protein (TIGR02619 family)
MLKPNVLVCTVGTSLFKPNLESLRKTLAEGNIEPALCPLAEAYSRGDWPATAGLLAKLPPSDRTCGAEINSIASMEEHGLVEPGARLFFLHSDTPDGFAIAEILCGYFKAAGWATMAVKVQDLQDKDPKRFRTKGLRQLAREVCKIIRDYTPGACAINATGGYKAQIAVAVLLGQAIGVPVYYKHELFPEIISFPPMPVALDFEVWMRASGMLNDLETTKDSVRWSTYEEEWEESFESLVERVSIDGVDYLDLSATGQIFHETFRERFRSKRDQVEPPPAPPGTKKPPRLEDAGWPGTHPEVRRFMQRVTDEVPQVIHCDTTYYNPALSQRTRFRISAKNLEGIFSNGSYTVKFRVDTTANTDGQMHAMAAVLNDWLQNL